MVLLQRVDRRLERPGREVRSWQADGVLKRVQLGVEILRIHVDGARRPNLMLNRVELLADVNVAGRDVDRFEEAQELVERDAVGAGELPPEIGLHLSLTDA